MSLQDKEKARISLKIASELKDSDWKRALHYIEYSEELVKKIDLEEVTANNNIAIAGIYRTKDAYDVALAYYLKAYEFYQQDNTNEKKHHLEGSLAIVYAASNNWEKAMYYFRNLLKHYTKNKAPFSIAKTYNNIGRLYMSKNDLDSAMVNFEKALQLIQNLEDDDLKTVLYSNLGYCYAQKNNFDRASYYFYKSLHLIKNKSDNSTKSWIYNSISNLYLLQKKSDSALFYSKKAAEITKISKYGFQNKDAVFNLYKSYLLKGDYKNAATYFEEYNQIRDSLNVEEKGINIEKLKLEQQYKENEEVRVLKETKENFKYYIIVFSLIIVMLVLFILLIKYKNKLSKAQLEKDLFESKKKELVTLSMMEIQRAEIIEQILDDLKQLKLQSPKKETQQTIDLIIKQLGQNNNSNVWEEFELHYGQVYESFYNILNEKHPELTYRDKRLCALLKLNLTTKEIAQITGQSIKSLENARTRLRKKLDLTNTNQDLITYLINLH
ncbi:tetratricopeptide repeat protein [Flavobacterium sp.]|uniref:tetratricopeptide repeat protein n=1 Tax=Flavobacterium sp. TaxID=239 RepID=UPI003D6C07CF